MRKKYFPILVCLLWISTGMLLTQKVQSQCLTVESILADACAPPNNPLWEGLNEMFRFRVGAQPINAQQMQISWANNIQFIPFNGFIQNTQTASVTASLNATIQSCGWLLEPPSFILPANSRVLVVTSAQLDINANSFASLSDTLYILYHDHAGVVYDPNYGTTVAYGHFLNYNTNPAIPNIQTLGITVGTSGCSVSVSYNKSLLVTQAGTVGAQDGGTVIFNSSGTLSYVNNGCIAPVPVISAAWTPPGTICSNASPVNLNSLVTGTTGGAWSGTGVSGNQFNPSGLSGLVAITYTVNPGPCAKVSTQNINVSTIGTPSWTPPSGLCSGNQVSLNSLITGTTGGTWTGQGVSGATFNSIGLSGNINITYTVGTAPCQTSSTQAISVTPRGNPAWTPPSGLCAGDVVSLNNLITGTSGGTWSGQGVTGSTLNTTGLTGNINITYTVGSGNCKDSSTRSINILQQANASWNPPSGLCAGDVVSLNNFITGTTGGTWSGQGITGSTLNTTGLSGNINITYTVGSGNCKDSSTRAVNIGAPSNASWTPPAPLCAGDVLSLNNLITGTTGGTWSGQGVNGATFNSAGLSGSISITYKAGSGSCIDSFTQTIQVISSGNAGWTSPGTICNDASPINLNTFVTGTTGGTWSGQGVSSSGTFNPAGLSGSVPITYSVGQGNCQGQSVQNITVATFTTFPLTADKSTICAGDSARVCAPTGYVSYNWNVGGSSNCVAGKNAGAYYVNVTDANGCTGQSQRFNLAVYPVPSVSVIVQGDTLSSFGAVSYQWILNGTDIPGATSPIFIAKQSGIYSLRIVDNNGCTATSTGVQIVKTSLDDQEHEKSALVIFANPVKENILQLQLEGKLNGLQLTLHSAIGQLVIEKIINNSRMQIDVSALPAGVYLLQAGEVAKKLVISR